MDETYDAIVLGTGLKECILSGLLSVKGKKVLHMDRNSYYGGESASLSLSQLWEKFKPGEEPPASLGKSNQYNIDLVPKMMMANGKLIKVLLHTKVKRYLEFKAVQGSFVLRNGKIHKVPANGNEAFKSPLMPFMEKFQARAFLQMVHSHDPGGSGKKSTVDLDKNTTREVFKQYRLESGTVDIIGHALALHRDDTYLDRPARDTVERIRLYHDSLARFNTGAPFLYLLYGLGELPQAFARLSAVYGGTYMLDKPDATVQYDEGGRATGVSSDGETAKCSFVVGDPSYFPAKTEIKSKVARAFCLMDHPIPGTNGSHSCQIILTGKQLNRKTDMYVFGCSYEHKIAAKGVYIALVSATLETDDARRELKPGIDLLGETMYTLVDVREVHCPTNNAERDGCFISQGFDATTHFESTVDDVLDMYRRITGEELDLSEESLGGEDDDDS